MQLHDLTYIFAPKRKKQKHEFDESNSFFLQAKIQKKPVFFFYIIIYVIFLVSYRKITATKYMQKLKNA